MCLAHAINTGYVDIWAPAKTRGHHLKLACSWPTLPAVSLWLLRQDVLQGCGVWQNPAVQIQEKLVPFGQEHCYPFIGGRLQPTLRGAPAAAAQPY